MTDRPTGEPEGREIGEILREIAAHPADDWQYRRLGAAFQSRGRLDEAERAVRKAIGMAPACQGHHVALGEILLEKNDPAAAQEILGAALPLGKESALLRFRLASTCQALDDPDGAVTHLEAALNARLSGNSADDRAFTFIPGSPEEGPDRLDPFPSLELLYQRLAEALLVAGLCGRAVRVCQEALARFPQQSSLLGYLVQAAIAVGDWGTALEPSRRLAHLFPGKAVFLRWQGSALRGLGRITEATAVYRRAVEICPDDADAWFELGTVLSRQGNKAEAADAYRRALQSAPDDSMIHYNLGCVVAEMGDYDAAIPSFRRAIAIDPDEARFHHNLGLCLERRGHLSEAAVHLGGAVRLAPDNAAMRAHLARVEANLRAAPPQGDRLASVSGTPLPLPDPRVQVGTRPGRPDGKNCDRHLFSREPCLCAAVADGAADAPQSARKALDQLLRLLHATPPDRRADLSVWAGFIPLLDSHLAGLPETTLVAVGLAGNRLIGVWAGDSHAFLLPASGPIIRLSASLPKTRLGSGQAAAGRFEREIAPGDLVLLMTDGAWSGFDDLRKLETLLRGARSRPGADLADLVLRGAEAAPNQDDKTVLVLAF